MSHPPTVPIQFAEYADTELPEVMRAQVLAFLRIVWPDGFVGANRFRTWTSQPGLNPHHLLFAAGSLLVSHLELVTVTVRVDSQEYRAVSPTAVLTYPAFEGEGWSLRLNAAALDRIDRSGADVGLLTCAPDLVSFYTRAGWEFAEGATIVAGPDEASWESDDVLLTRSLGERSQQLLSGLKLHPLRVFNEW